MTHRKAFEGTDKFVSRRYLKEDELRLVLQKRYSDDVIEDLIKSVKTYDVWVDCDGHVAVVYTYRPQDDVCPDRFVIVTTGENYNLLGLERKEKKE